MKTLDINNFSKSELTVKLAVINLNFNRKYSALIEEGKPAFISEVENIVKANFKYKPDQFELTVNHLCLHLLGNIDNVFDKTINK